MNVFLGGIYNTKVKIFFYKKPDLIDSVSTYPGGVGSDEIVGINSVCHVTSTPWVYITQLTSGWLDPGPITRGHPL